MVWFEIPGARKMFQHFRLSGIYMCVRLLLRPFFIVFACLLAARSDAQLSFTLPNDAASRHHTQATLLLSAATAKPGDTIWAAVDLKMEPEWHTYWKNPGEAGMATEIKWHLPPGVTAGEIQWPLPAKLPPAEVVTYGYQNEVMLIVPLTLASNLSPGPLDLKADLSWLECKEECIPVKTSVNTTLNIGETTTASATAADIQSWMDRVPQPLTNWTASAWWEITTNADKRKLYLALSGSADTNGLAPADTTDFLPDASDHYLIQGAVEKVTSPGSDYAMVKDVQKFDGDWPAVISGTLAITRGNISEGFTVRLPVAASAPTAATIPNQAVSAAGIQVPGSINQPLWLMLIDAFIGGLILNIMPCVLPVIALKILGFVNEAKSSPQRIRLLGVIYAAGVLFSFGVLAAAVIGVKVAGHQAGWGMQFGNPVFIVCLTALVTLVALNLFGVFEVTLGGRTLSAAGELAGRSGPAGAFFNGMLATALATPCTAPFLSIALGFAFAQSAGLIVLIFLFVGLGLAAPYVLLSWNPAWLRFLPKPGAWMEKFKIAMGFPMLATVAWLFNIAFSSYGRHTLWLGIFLVLLSAAAWVYGEFFQRGRQRRGLALGVVLALVAGGYAYALEDQLHWRTQQPVSEVNGVLENAPGDIAWQPWSPAAVAQARAAGRPVLVDFTADWCLTCQVNKKTSIDVPSVRAELTKLNAVTLIGDDTRYLDSITTELQRYNRAGVPLVLVYPKNPDLQPIVLPEVLTPGIVLAALEQAAK
jgi:thiol:disulfide interchange protein DsbD